MWTLQFFKDNYSYIVDVGQESENSLRLEGKETELYITKCYKQAVNSHYKGGGVKEYENGTKNYERSMCLGTCRETLHCKSYR